MGGPLKCKLKEGGGRIIRSFYKCDVVSAHSNAFQTRYAKRVYKVSIALILLVVLEFSVVSYMFSSHGHMDGI